MPVPWYLHPRKLKKNYESWIEPILEKMEQNKINYLDVKSKEAIDQNSKMEQFLKKIQESELTEDNEKLQSILEWFNNRGPSFWESRESSIIKLSPGPQNSSEISESFLKASFDVLEDKLSFIAQKFPKQMAIIEKKYSELTSKIVVKPLEHSEASLEPVLQNSQSSLENLSEWAQSLKSNISQFFESLEFDFFDLEILSDIPVTVIAIIAIEMIDQTLLYYKGEITGEEWQENIIAFGAKYGIGGLALTAVIIFLILIFPPFGLFIAGVPEIIFLTLSGGIVLYKSIQVWLKHKAWLFPNKGSSF